MKRMNDFQVLSLLAGVLAATLFFSCAKNEVADPGDSIQNPVADTEPDGEGSEAETPETSGDEQPADLVFGITINDGTKTHLGTLTDDSYPNLWSNGDAVSINGVSSGSLSAGDGYVGTKSARFPMRERVSKYSGNWYIGYPVGQFSSFDKGVGTVTIPTEQNYVEGSYDSRSFIMIGKSETEEVTFYPQVAMLRVTPKDASPSLGEGARVKSVTIAAIGGKQMSGTFTTNYTDGSLDAAGGASYITLNAPEGGIAFDKPFFFMVPEGTYTGGLRFTIVVSVGGVEKSMSFSNTNDYTADKTAAAKNITAPAFVESTLSAPSLTVMTPSSIAVSWNGSNPANDKKKAWKISVYSNNTCTALVREVTIPAQAKCWKDSKGVLQTYPTCFAIGGLTAGSTYYVKVTDVANNVTSPSAGVTLSGTNYSVVPMPASITSASDNVFAQNFNVPGWGPADIYINSSEVQAGGYYPAAPRDDFSDYSTEGAEFRRFNNEMQCSSNDNGFDWSGSNLNGWLFNRNVFFCSGFLKVGNGGNFGYAITPPFTVADGKVARIDVSVIAAKAHSDCINNFALAVVSSATQESSAQGFTWPDTSDETVYKTVTINSTAWTEAKASNLYVHNGDRIVFSAPSGATNDGTKRVFLRGLKVDVKEVFTGLDIHDETTLFNFSTYVAQEGKAGTNAQVTRSFSVSSAWTPIDGYTGTLEGNDKTITGLTKPFFEDLKGTVQNLTLNSTLNVTTDPEDDYTHHGSGIGIFALQMEGGTLSNCTSRGSLSFSPSVKMSNGTRNVGGMVGYVGPKSTMSACTNYATVSAPANGQNNELILNLGGVVGKIDNSSGTACSNLVNRGSLSSNMVVSYSLTSNNFELRMGGVAGQLASKSISTCKNYAEVAFSGSVYGSLTVGGIIGRTTQGLSSCENYGYVHSSGTARRSEYDIRLGGVAGHSTAAFSNCKNYAYVLNQGDSSGDICVGGIVGIKDGSTMSGCSNNATVRNTGDGSSLTIGGLVGWNDTGATTFTSCYNTGKVCNTGTGSNATAGLQIAGLIGRIDAGSTLSSSGNYNYGPVADTSSTAKVAMAGVCGYASASGADLGSSENRSSGTIRLAGSRTNAYVGGVAGYSLASNSGKNYGAVGVSGSCTDSLCVGGVVGLQTTSALSSCENHGAVTNSASVSGSESRLTVGGVVGVLNDVSITSCQNDAAVSNTGDSPKYVCIGGVVGHSYRDLGTVTFTTCKNTSNGFISNQCSTTTTVARIGGIVGYAQGATTLSGTSTAMTNCNYNAGAISDSSTQNWGADDTGEKAVGGICGYLDDASTTLAFDHNAGQITVGGSAKNALIGGIIGSIEDNMSANVGETLNEGNIFLTSLSVRNLRVGGIMGLSNGIPGISGTFSNYTTNKGNIKFTTCNVVSQVAAGGVFGAIDGDSTLTIEYCRNEGTITTNTLSNSSTDISTTKMGAYNYIGGIGTCTAAEGKNKTYRNCKNIGGHIKIYVPSRTRIGGITAAVSIPPSNCEVQADLTLGASTSSDVCAVGGIAGFKGNRNGDTYSNLTYIGTIDTHDVNYATTLTTGLVPARNNKGTGTTTSWTNCVVGGTIKGADTNTNSPGLFTSTQQQSDNRPTITCSGCQIKNWTKLIRGASTTTFSTDSQPSASNWCGYLVGNYGTKTTSVSGISVVN